MFVNLVGCVEFLASALLAINSAADLVVRFAVSNGFLLQGSIGFFIGSVLLMPEAATKQHGISGQAEIVPEYQPMEWEMYERQVVSSRDISRKDPSPVR